MLATFLWLGTILGFTVGLVHAVHILASQARLPGTAPATWALYRGLWALGLWTLFGGYLLAFWILGAALRPVIERLWVREGAV